ncbi:hypothetical protein PAERUG_E15_London_28_01_14_07034 [Pseudomonas aeruginosa]|nr:hypothetical protein PAERUG_E15_London_28_01_14_07034 [Pseudomonas aeruginosa]
MKALAQHHAASVLLDPVEAARITAQRLPRARERGSSRRIVQPGTGLVHEVIAGGAVAGPAVGQLLALGQYLLHMQAHRLRITAAGRTGCVKRFTKAPQVGARGRQAIHMIDTQAVHPSLAYQPQRQRMHRLEHVIALHPQRGQFIDIEKAPVVHLIARRAPPGQPVVLPLQQRMQPFNAAVAALGPRRPLRGVQWMAARRQGQRQTMVAQHGTRVVHHHAHYAIAHRVVQRPVQCRQPEPALAARRLPVDVKPCCVRASTPVHQHIVPPMAVRGRRQMVGYDVEDQAHAVRARRCGQLPEGFFAAQFRIDAGRVDAIVAMRRPRQRSGDRRQV